MKTIFSPLLLFLALSAPLFAQTPYQVKVINAGADARPERMIEYNGKLLFRARTAAQGIEPWISDGTEAGTVLLKDINDNPSVSTGNSNADNFTVYKNKVYFKARDAVNGDELWVTDGTTEGTIMLKNIHPTANGNPIDIVIFKDLLFFTATDNTSSSELWVSDGTAEGTRLFLDINPGSGVGNPGSKTVIGNYMYFSASNGANGNEIWRTDGTVEGTKMIKDIRAGTANGLPSRFFGFNNEVYFRVNDGTNGVELWKTDGTEEGTVLVKDIRPGSGNSNPDNFFIVNNRLYFTADDGVNGVELWVTDGTTAGTTLALDFNPAGSGNPSNFLEIIPGIHLLTATDTLKGTEPWLFLNVLGFSDTSLVQDLNPGPASSSPEYFVDNGYDIFFSATVAGSGKELYVLSLGADTIQRVAEINPGAGDGKVEELVRVGNRIFFRADNGTDGLQLWAVEAPIAQLVVRDGDKTLALGDTLDFGNVAVGTTAKRELKLANTGSAPLVIFDYGFFDLNIFTSDLLEDEVAPGDSVTLYLEFTPKATGPVEERFAIISFSASNERYPIVLRGNGIIPTSVVEPVVFGVDVFPNPTAETLFIRMQQPTPGGTAMLLNANGQLVRQASLSQQSIQPLDLKGLPAGMYFLRLNAEGKTTFIQVVKQ